MSRRRPPPRKEPKVTQADVLRHVKDLQAKHADTLNPAGAYLLVLCRRVLECDTPPEAARTWHGVSSWVTPGLWS